MPKASHEALLILVAAQAALRNLWMFLLTKQSGLGKSEAAFSFCPRAERETYIPMPLMPPMPPGIAGLPLSSSGSSETIASVVSIKPAIEAAF